MTHGYNSKSLYIARLLCANLELAHVCGPSTHIELPFPRARTRERKTFEKTCQECQASYNSHLARSKFCTDTCRLKHNKLKYLRRKKANPTHYADLRAKRNMAWIKFYGGTGEVPKLPGRKTKLQSQRVTEFHQAKTRLHQLKRNRTIHQ